MNIIWLLCALFPIQSMSQVSETAYSHNCNCGTRIANYPSGRDTPQLCRNVCEANPKCKSFGLWTKESKNAGWCAIFDTPCGPTCPTPTNTPEGWFNDVFNRNADEVSESNVITWLRKLIAEGLNEIDLINRKVNTSVVDLAAAQSRFNLAEEKEGEALVKKDEAAEEVNKVKGKCAANQKVFDQGAIDLNQEIGVFNQVISTLRLIKDGDKGLLEENKVDISSFISLADQANPAKVQQVIDLVIGLREASQAQLKDLYDQVKDCKIELARKIVAHSNLIGAWKRAVSYKEDRKKELDEAKGTHDAVVQHADHRIPIVSSEVDDLRKVIELLSTLV